MNQYIRIFDSIKQINYKTEILAGITVSIAMVPESIAFALVAGLSPLTGLYAAFTVGLITSIFGGRPGMISGAAGATAVVIIALAKTHGVEYVFATTILAGTIQLVVGILKLGKLIRLVPQPVMYGFVNGLAIVIFMSQLDQFKTIDSLGLTQWMRGTELFFMLSLVALTMLIIWLLPRFTKSIPAPLVAILVVSAIVISTGVDTKNVGDIASINGKFPPFHIPSIPFNLETLKTIFPYAVIVAGVGLVESLLTLNLVDEITDTRGWGNKECVAQGSANIFSGFFSGMGGCAMIGQSLINVSSGGRTRISGIVTSLMVLFYIMFASGIIEKIPMAALTGVMIMIAIGTFEWASLKTFNKMPFSDVAVIVIVAGITVIFHNLALAVLVGVIISALVFAWENAKQIRISNYLDENGIKHYHVTGPLFFGSTTTFNEHFDVNNDPDEVIIDFSKSRVTDMSAIEALNKLTTRYLKAGKRLHLRHLSKDCRELLRNADQIIEINILEDPTYKVLLNNNRIKNKQIDEAGLTL